MCTYNGEKYVQTQLESILTQSRPPDHVLICDDVSSDGTVRIIEEVASRHAFPVRLIRNTENLHVSRNFDKAIREAEGDVIFMSDFDDCWFKDKVATMLPVFEADPNVVLVYCDAELADASLRPLGDTVFGRRPILRSPAQPDSLGRAIYFNTPMIAFRSSLKPAITPISNQWVQDHWISFIAYALGTVKFVDKTLVYYRRHATNRGADPDLDGGKLYHWRRAAQMYSTLGNYANRRKRWEQMLAQLRRVKADGTPVAPGGMLDDLLEVCEESLRFARVREELKTWTRPRRIPGATRALLSGDYHRLAYGFKSFVQDVGIA